MVALLLGMPIALAFGFLGAIVTSLLSMLFAAVGVWDGTWFHLLPDHAGFSWLKRPAIPRQGKVDPRRTDQ